MKIGTKRDFYGDVWYLFKYNSAWTALLVILNSVIYYFLGFDPSIHWHPAFLGLTIAGFLLSVTSFALIHNASHNNFKYYWISKLIGELNGFIQLWGYEGWKWLHIYHHRYTDDPEKDPHTPFNTSLAGYFRVYIKASLKYVLDIRLDWLREQGISGARLAFYSFLFSSSLRISAVARIAFFVLVSPTFTVFFLIPFTIGSIVAAAHVNYYGHMNPKTRELGLRNVSEGTMVKLLNLISFNLWYHKNHHLNPKLFDPKVFSSETETPAKAEENTQVA